MTPSLRRAGRQAALRAVHLAFAASPILGVAARPAAAQTVSAAYAPGCGPAGACTTVRFAIANTTGAALTLNTFGLAAGGSAFAFRPIVAGGSVGGFQADDDAGDPFGGTTTLTNAGRDLFIDFLDPSFGGIPFTLNLGSSGFVDVELDAAPALRGGAFSFTAVRGDNSQVSGAVAVVPEPGTVALLGAGLLGVAGVAARRRRV